MQLSEHERNKSIIKYNLIGIGANFVLAVFKLIVGFMIHSRALQLDGVNGLSDMLSSLIAILSTTAASKKSDKHHPMGYGRLEYISSLFITVLIMYMGIRAIIDSVGIIISPEDPPQYSMIAIIIVIVSIIFKIGYGILLRREGKRINSVALIMTGTEGMGDALSSAGILLAIIVLRVSHFNIEPYVCILISLLILYTGVGMLRECMDKIIGARIDSNFQKNIKQKLVMEDGVLNVCNLVIHQYGENKFVGSVDIEVEADMKAEDVTKLSRRLIRKASENNLTLTSIGITGSSLDDPRAAEIWDTIIDVVRSQEGILRAQLFTVDFEEKVISFYVVEDYGYKNREDSVQQLMLKLENIYPDMLIEIYRSIDI